MKKEKDRQKDITQNRKNGLNTERTKERTKERQNEKEKGRTREREKARKKGVCLADDPNRLQNVSHLGTFWTPWASTSKHFIPSVINKT